ncbi:TrbI/VirB10 family protein [Luteimonas aquatica]|uniref:TrbI/VirB10 family protein n=1 Tax=Luteimonas aquatica TaxID=450364 RepID=UPI001F56BFD6|nr:TrbI/VirB10 family protein [Luteimonas aquatica]
MNQNLPPNENENDTNNPYYGGSQNEDAAPDLDAQAPELKSNEDQRVNRKAMIFLLLLLVLLIPLIYFLFFGGSGDKKDEAPKKPQQAVVVPDLPQGAPQVPGADTAEPIALREVPPLPPPPAGAGQQQDAYSDGPRQPTLLERRLLAEGSNNSPSSGVAPPPQGAGPGGLLGGDGEDVSQAQVIRNPDTLLVRGTYIRCILETRIITDVPGFTSCIVTEPVYSINGRKLLLPKGSKVLGAYDTEPSGPRIAVIWDRITTPNGFDISMRSPGVDNLGSAGHPGKFNAHWPSKIASALMISLIADAFKYAAAEHGPTRNEISQGGVIVQSPYESATARTMENLANQALQRSMSRPPTVTINQGTLLNIYVSKDVDFVGVIPNEG